MKKILIKNTPWNEATDAINMFVMFPEVKKQYNMTKVMN